VCMYFYSQMPCFHLPLSDSRLRLVSGAECVYLHETEGEVMASIKKNAIILNQYVKCSFG